ncbi:3-hydroxyacyl-ACP dehydratase FabZ [Elusimicrobiota bacterium]
MDIKRVENGKNIDINEIKNLIPHRYPFLLIDKAVLSIETNEVTGYKCVSANEGFFQGHFPGNPVMPGVLMVEGMAQTACCLLLSKPENRGKTAFFMAINNVKFRKTVIPGDVVEYRIAVLRDRNRGGMARGEAYVNNERAVEAEFMFAVIQDEGKK